MNKNFIKSSILSVAAMAVLSGCMGGGAAAPAPAAAAPAAPQFGCTKDGAPAPKWTCVPYVENSIAAIGIAQPNAGNDQGMQMSEAMAEARDSLANQISVKVSTLFKSFKATTGSGTDATFDKSTSKVSKQLASQTLNGSRLMDSFTSAKGTLYVLVAVSNEPVKQGMEEAVNTSFKNDKAMYQKFLAAKADGELDKELEKAAE